MDDVAKRANVSVATVSRVYSNPDKVSPKNRQKVYEAIKELDYQPNVLARNLRRLQTNTFLVVVPNIVNTFFTSILKTIQATAIESGYQVLLGDTNRSPDLEESYIRLLKQRMVDGVILLFPRMETAALEAIAEEYPVVIVGRKVSNPDIPFVTNDNAVSTRAATEHIIKLGHRRIGYLAGTLNLEISSERLKGFRQAMEQNGLETDEALIREGDFYLDAGYSLALEMLSSPNRPTAVIAASDEMAIGAMRAAKELGISVPSQLAVMGFDDIRMASICEPPLSTIAQPKEEFGKISTQLLIALLQGRLQSKSHIFISDELIIRQSCGAELR